MVIAIVIGRGGSKGMPGKNSYIINRHPMMAYPIMAARDCDQVDEVFFSTEDDKLKDIAKEYGASIIDRPKELATDETLGEDVFVHAYNWVNERPLLSPIELVVLMFANAPCITSDMISEMIKILRESDADSICTVSKCNMFSPYRMRYINDKKIVNFLRQSQFSEVSCDRDSGGDFYIYDCSCAVVRPHCLEDINYGFLPQKWLGRNILPFVQETPALDVDYAYQIGQVEYWLNKHWFV